MNRKLTSPLVLAFLLTSISYCQTLPRESLRGLKGVFLYVHPVDKDVQAGGLSTSRIYNAAESQLRDAGITVYKEPQAADGSANLVIIIDIVKHPQGAYLYEVEVSLLQEVHLARVQVPDPFPSQTWGAKAIGLTTPNRMDLMLEPLRARVGDFIKDYLSVNPKPGKSPS